MTVIINLIGGPCIGKTTLAAKIYYKMNKASQSIEYVSEYAKKLVWTQNWDQLDNQYEVTRTQIENIDMIRGEVDYIVTDAAVMHGLYYNNHNPHNSSNRWDVDDKIKDHLKDTLHERLDIILTRNHDCPFVTVGRIHGYEESVAIDQYFSSWIEKNPELFPNAHRLPAHDPRTFYNIMELANKMVLSTDSKRGSGSGLDALLRE